MKKIAFIGSGNMGGALAKAVCKQINSSEVILTNRTYEKAEKLSQELNCNAVKSNIEAVKNAEYVVLAVKPQMLDTVLKEISGEISLQAKKRNLTLISIAAGKTIDFIQNYIDVKIPIIRMLPNTPAAIGQGMTVCAKNDLVTEEQMDACIKLFEKSGLIEEIPENLINAAGTVTGCSPAWIYMFIEALADGGVECGVPRASAVKYAAQALVGSAELVLKTNKHPGQLKDEVCSPGGTTIAGVHALEKSSFRGTVMSAVTEAYKKTLSV